MDNSRATDRAWRAATPGRLLPASFYARHTVAVAQDLLGKVVVVRQPKVPGRPRAAPEFAAGRIVETEAYRADDAASHSARGETPRCSVMFGAPGRAYVYFIYGMYEMLNFVTEPRGAPGAVLIRALEPAGGEASLQAMLRNRPTPSKHDYRDLANGPGRLCRALGIARGHNGQSLRGPELFVADDGFRPERVAASPRVGISQARELAWRFFIAGNSFVSRVKQNAQAEPVPGGLP